jgi:hypothetical protein
MRVVIKLLVGWEAVEKCSSKGPVAEWNDGLVSSRYLLRALSEAKILLFLTGSFDIEVLRLGAIRF